MESLASITHTRAALVKLPAENVYEVCSVNTVIIFSDIWNATQLLLDALSFYIEVHG